MPTLVGVTVTLDGSPLAGRTVSVGSDTAVTDGSGLATISTGAAGPGNNVVCATGGGETATWSFSNASTGDSGSGSGFTAGPQNLGAKGANNTTFTLTSSPPPPPPPSPPPPPPPASSSTPAPTGTVEVTVNLNGSPITPYCHVRLIAGTYDEVGLFVDPTANPLVFTDVPVTTGVSPTEATVQVFCAYSLMQGGCTAEASAAWSGGSLPATVLDADGFSAGFEVTAGGTTEVVIDIGCAVSPSSPPPPPGCCPEVWWCAEGGGTVSHPVGPRPEGVVGRPKRSQAVAERECPPLTPSVSPPQSIETCCDPPQSGGMPFPNGAVVTLANKTGIYLGTGYPNSVAVTFDAGGCAGSGVCHWQTLDDPAFGVTVVELFCTGSTRLVRVYYSTCANTAVAVADGWTATAYGAGTGQAFEFVFNCGDDLGDLLTGTMFLGTYTADPAGCGGGGTVDVYITWF